MSYVSGAKRIVRNPITGEELVYEKGRPVVVSIDPNIYPQKRVEQLLSNLYVTQSTMSSVSHSIAPTSQINGTKSEFVSEVNMNKETSSSVLANRGSSSIPMLNLSDLASEDRTGASNRNTDVGNQKINYKQELANLVEKQAILSDLRHQQQQKQDQSNPIVHPIFLQNSARPKSAYDYGIGSKDLKPLDSPIIRFQQNQKQLEQSKLAVSPIPSNLDAPREQPKQPAAQTVAQNAPKSNENTPRTFESLILPKPPLSEKKESIYKIERVADLEKLWLESGALTPLPCDSNIKSENDEKTKFLKEKLVIDTIVTDQLSKFPLNNDLTDNQNLSLKTIYTARGNRHTIVNNHLRPINSLSENILSKKCKFSCRVKTSSGKLALRELFGLIFLYDGSLTIYEFRLLCGAYVTGMGSGNSSKKTTALPFIHRKVYVHAFGRRKGQQIEIWDIFKGSVVYLPNTFLASEQSSLPMTARNSEYVEVEVTDVDEIEKENLLTSIELANNSLSSHEMSNNAHDIKHRLKQPLTEIEQNDRKILASIRFFMRKQIEKRSTEVYMGVSRLLRARSKPNQSGQYGFVTIEDLHNALNEFNVQIHSEDLNIAWQVLDLNMTGRLSYYVLLRALFGEMNIVRHNHFRTLVRKLDTQKTGYIQTNEIAKYYKVARHPRVRSGDIKEEDLKNKFLSSFDLMNPAQVPEFFELSTTTDSKSPIITYEQFEEYYNGLSIIVDTDEDFLKILRNSWNLV